MVRSCPFCVSFKDHLAGDYSWPIDKFIQIQGKVGLGCTVLKVHLGVDEIGVPRSIHHLHCPQSSLSKPEIESRRPLVLKQPTWRIKCKVSSQSTCGLHGLGQLACLFSFTSVHLTWGFGSTKEVTPSPKISNFPIHASCNILIPLPSSQYALLSLNLTSSISHLCSPLWGPPPLISRCKHAHNRLFS